MGRHKFKRGDRVIVNQENHWRKREDRHWSERPKAARFYNWLTRKKGK